MRVVFFGTSEFGVPALKSILAAGHQLAAAVSTIEKPKGRGLTIEPSPVKSASQALNITVFEPENPNAENFVAQLRTIHPDLVVLAAYRFILKAPVLGLPRLGCLNIHPSLLPRYRGAAPIQRAIMAGETRTGVSIFLMNEKIDQGDIILQKPVEIGTNETYGELSVRLAELGAELAVEGLDLVNRGSYAHVPQNRGEGNYAPKIAKEERLVDWTRPARDVHNLIRGLSPEPGAYVIFRGKRLELLGSELSEQTQGSPGELVVAGKRLLCVTSEGAVALTRVKPEGGKTMTGADFINGRRIVTGERLGV